MLRANNDEKQSIFLLTYVSRIHTGAKADLKTAGPPLLWELCNISCSSSYIPTQLRCALCPPTLGFPYLLQLQLSHDFPGLYIIIY